MFTAGNYSQGVWLYLRDSIVGKEIVPAVKVNAGPGAWRNWWIRRRYRVRIAIHHNAFPGLLFAWRPLGCGLGS
jgi:hypothetical protein